MAPVLNKLQGKIVHKQEGLLSIKD